MQQYFIETGIEKEITFNDEQSHHIKNVMRMKEGTIVKAVDFNEKAALYKIHYEGKKVCGILYEVIAQEEHKSIKIKLAM